MLFDLTGGRKVGSNGHWGITHGGENATPPAEDGVAAHFVSRLAPRTWGVLLFGGLGQREQWASMLIAHESKI